MSKSDLERLVLGAASLEEEMQLALTQHRQLLEADGGVRTSLVEFRAQQDRLAAFWSRGAPRVHAIEDLTIPRPGGAMLARLYRAARTSGVIIFLHGGGWARGTISTTEWACCALAAETGLAVLSLDYRLAPEHPFPAALEDVCAAMDWCVCFGIERGLDGRCLSLSGVSAGANLALAAALVRRDEGKTPPVSLGLFYGVYDDDFNTDSYVRYGSGDFNPSRAGMRQYFEWYVPCAQIRHNPYITPMHAELSGLQKVWLGAAEYDVARDDSIRLAQRLSDAGCDFELKYYPSLAHGFLMYARTVSAARAALSDAAGFFRASAAARVSLI